MSDITILAIACAVLSLLALGWTAVGLPVVIALLWRLFRLDLRLERAEDRISLLECDSQAHGDGIAKVEADVATVDGVVDEISAAAFGDEAEAKRVALDVDSNGRMVYKGDKR